MALRLVWSFPLLVALCGVVGAEPAASTLEPAGEPVEPAAPVGNDVVHLTDGSRLVGTLVQMHEGSVVIRTAFAGELKLPAEALKGIHARRKMTLVLPSGDRVTGVPKYDARRGQVLTQTAFGEVPVAGAITAAWPADAPEPVTAVHQAQLAAIQAEQARLAPRWTTRLEVGINGSTGNTERATLMGKAEIRRTTPTERFLAFIQGYYASENGQRSKNEVLGGVREEIDISDRWFVFGKLDLEFDEFEDLDLRATASAGLGYFFVKDKDHEFKVRGGLGYQHESFMDGSSTNEAVLELGYDYRLDLWQWLRFTHSLTYFPALSSPIEDYRLMAETAGEVPLEKDGLWRIRAGMRNEYDSLPRPGIERLDTTYFLNLVYDLK